MRLFRSFVDVPQLSGRFAPVREKQSWFASFALTQHQCARILCYMNLTLSVREQLVERARKRAASVGKSLNQVIREYLESLAGADDPERSIAEFKSLSGRGHSRGWRFNRDEIHERS